MPKLAESISTEQIVRGWVKAFHVTQHFSQSQSTGRRDAGVGELGRSRQWSTCESEWVNLAPRLKAGFIYFRSATI
jgi:hypothetical protein